MKRKENCDFIKKKMWLESFLVAVNIELEFTAVFRIAKMKKKKKHTTVLN